MIVKFYDKNVKNKESIPSWGISQTLSIYLISSRVEILGDRPPWRPNIEFSTIAVRGR